MDDRTKGRVLEADHTGFEGIRQQTEGGTDFWSGRALQGVLGYSSWDKFKVVIQKAIKACENAGNPSSAYFSRVGKIVKTGLKAGSALGVERHISNYDYRLSRYACYLIVQNSDPSKPVIAQGQTYFAIQTRRQELADNKAFQQLDEDKKRLFLRDEMKEHNKQLVETASKAGVKSSLDFAIFQNHGYQGLYGGLDAKDIHKQKGLKKGQGILDHMVSTELAANLFRATQTEDKLRRENIAGKEKANQVHYEVGGKVRKTIKELGGTMPENLPIPEKGIKTLKQAQKRYLKIKGSTSSLKNRNQGKSE